MTTKAERDLCVTLTAKTSEIEWLVAEEQGLGDINAMDPTDYDRLRTYAEGLIETFQEEELDEPGQVHPEGPLTSLLREWAKIENQILDIRAERLEKDAAA
jgi:hypothetical protein